MKTHLILLFISFTFGAKTVLAQTTPYERMGQKEMSGGNFTAAANYFEQAYVKDNSNMNALWLMGYSNYHALEYRKSIDAFNKLIAMKPTETAAYYYRGKAKVLLSGTIKDYKSTERGKLIHGAIKDFTTALDFTPSDYKLYQNRGLAYQEYAIYRSQRVADIYNKVAAINAANASIADFQKVLEEGGFRRDINAQIEKSKQLLADIK
ncbi:tetratricopeptide repeat protein [Pedobacter alpinus]|uniref:Tetratricopeptide repeat protein n=1 Tax=Pedobacter alpinus TaxID=1590643 RepID=A0ABW5TRX8_9SPHI